METEIRLQVVAYRSHYISVTVKDFFELINNRKTFIECMTNKPLINEGKYTKDYFLIQCTLRFLFFVSKVNHESNVHQLPGNLIKLLTTIASNFINSIQLFLHPSIRLTTYIDKSNHLKNCEVCSQESFRKFLDQIPFQEFCFTYRGYGEYAETIEFINNYVQHCLDKHVYRIMNEEPTNVLSLKTIVISKLFNLFIKNSYSEVDKTEPTRKRCACCKNLKEDFQT